MKVELVHGLAGGASFIDPEIESCGTLVPN